MIFFSNKILRFLLWYVVLASTIWLVLFAELNTKQA